MLNTLVLKTELESHDNELFKATNEITDLEHTLDKLIKLKHITNETHDFLFEETAKILDHVGSLSQQIFDVEQEIEDLYAMEYKHSPELGLKLWYEYYEQLHKPYTNIKNRCWRMFDSLDVLYINCNKSKPSNWDKRLGLENKATLA